jgi:hypothetical protein
MIELVRYVVSVSLISFDSRSSSEVQVESSLRRGYVPD